MGQRWAGAAIPAALMMMMPHAAIAQAQTLRTYNIPEQDLAAALKAFAAASGREVVASSDLLAGKRSGIAVGPLSPEQAVEHILAGTGLSYRIVEGAFVIRPRRVAGADEAPARDQSEIVVTGSRIRGGSVASPVLTIDQETLRDTGITDIGEAVRRIPQSFGGGQNPGIGINVPAASGIDIGGSSSVNLRGLGSDATLTLLNGKRLAYTAVKQSVDVSAIPFIAIDRIEIVPDGASAIYGSDAVAGVANVILRHEYDGLETSARVAAATDGGDFEQQYDALAGTTWVSGGALIAYEYSSNTAIRAKDRSYAANRSPGLDLFPAMRHHSAIVTAHQQLGDNISFNIDGLYNIRWSDLTFPTVPGGDLDEGRATFSSLDRAFAIAPALELTLGADWTLALLGTYGKDRVDYHQLECSFETCTDSVPSFYRNTAQSFEFNGNGNLLALPAGVAKIALGAGYRKISFRRFAGPASTVNTAHTQDEYYAFGELNVPLIGPSQNVPFASRVDASAALRYERYPGIDEVVTPKIGLVWGVTPDVDLKASWGKSFRAATLYQQHQPRAVYLFPPAALGGAGYPSSAGALIILGGNPELKPERANTWSATLALHPRALPGARLEITYFDVDYRDRIVAPIAITRQALSNPIYRDQIVLNPSEAEQRAVIASAGTFLNITGAPYDPTNVIAIVDNGNVNAGRQRARGVDVLASYSTTIAHEQRLNLSADVAYLKSDQQLSPTQPELPLAGTIYNPPHWRGQVIAGWSNGPLTLTASGNYIGGVRDIRFTPAATIDPMTTFDVTARYRVKSESPVLGGLDLTLSFQNIFNAKPDPIATSIPYDTPYDSTNYSPVGRLIAFQVRKSW